MAKAAYWTITDAEARKRGECDHIVNIIVVEFHSCERTPQAEYLMR